MITYDELRTWSESLKSGAFKQCRNTLHEEINDSYCCLGVLDKVVITKPQPFNESKYYNIEEMIGKTNHFIRMNDSYGFSFDQIASYIDGVLLEMNPGDSATFLWNFDEDKPGHTIHRSTST